MIPTKQIATGVVVLTTMLSTLAGQAQELSDGPVTIVVPYAAGGAMDILARTLSEPLSAEIGRPVVVENQPGGGTVVGTKAVLGRPADGHTLYLTTAALVTAPAMTADVGYDPFTDFVPIMETTNQVMVVSANAGLGLESIDDLIAYFKENPDKAMYASAGAGSASHLSAYTFFKAAGIDATHVPFAGSGPAIPEIISGRIPVMFDAYSSSLPQQQAGTLNFLAQTPATASTILPDVPAISDSMPGYGFDSWHAIFVRADTPQPIVDYLTEAVASVLAAPEMVTSLTDLGMEIRAVAGPEFLPALEAEAVTRAQIVKELNLTN